MWITVFLGWLDTRSNGETTPGKSCKFPASFLRRNSAIIERP
jgi:hypothetical protein